MAMYIMRLSCGSMCSVILVAILSQPDVPAMALYDRMCEYVARVKVKSDVLVDAPQRHVMQAMVLKSRVTLNVH